MKLRADRYSASVLLCALGSVAGAMAGPITPPPGPVAGTGKTLTEVEPRIAINATNTPGDSDSVYRINQAGSYYLTGTLSLTDARSGIEIGVSGAVVDLNGFTISGGTSGAAGVKDLAGGSVVRNGSVLSTPAGGIIVGEESLVEDVSVAASSFTNAITIGERSVVRRATVVGGTAVLADRRCVIEDVTGTNVSGGVSAFGKDGVVVRSSRFNSFSIGAGVDAGAGLVVEDCTFDGMVTAVNGGSGSRVVRTETDSCTNGFTLGTRSVVQDCIVRGSAAFGIQAGAELSMSRVSVHGGSNGGVIASNDASLDGVTVVGAGFRGISVGSRVTLANCVVSGTTVASSIGIVVVDNAVLTDCRADENLGDGISGRDAVKVVGAQSSGNSGRGIVINNGGTVEGCNVRNNALGGVVVNFSCRVCGNNTNGNGGGGGVQGGIMASGRQNEIVENHSSFDDVGISVSGSRNLVARNTVGEPTSGTAFSIAAGNSFGPIVNVAGVGAFTGVANSTHPQANFEQ
jgi:hypothetical protein